MESKCLWLDPTFGPHIYDGDVDRYLYGDYDSMRELIRRYNEELVRIRKRMRVLEIALQKERREFIIVGDDVAEKMVRDVLKKLKKSAKTNMIHINELTHLPYQQIEKMMEKLEEEGVVSEVED
jgi:predicted methyltransferase